MANPFLIHASAPRAKATPAPAAPTPRARQGDPTLAALDALRTGRARAFITARRSDFEKLPPQLQSQLGAAARQEVKAAGLGEFSPGFKGDYFAQQVTKAGQDVKGIPGGLYHAAGAVAGDVKDTVHGRPTVKRTVGVAEETGKGLFQTVTHPGSDLFQTATLAAAAFSAGAGAVGRLGAVADVVKATPAADLATAVGRLSKADSKAYAVLANPTKHLPHVDEPTARRIATPSPELGRVLDLDPHLATERSAFVKRVGDGTVEPAPPARGAAVREVGASKPAQIAKAIVKTPLPKQRTITVPGTDGRPAIVTHPVASKNAAVNLIERRVLDPARQRQLDRAAPGRLAAAAETLPGGAKIAEGAARLVSAETKVGRELRAHRSVIDSLELAPVSRLDRFHPSAPARGLTKVTGGRVNVATVLPRKLGGERLSAAEQKAVDIMAAGSNPGETIAYHENLLGRGVGDQHAHQLQIALSKAAGPHFNRLMTGDHPKLQQAVEETRALIQKSEGLKGLTPEEIAHRVGARQADIRAVAAGKVSPLEEIQHLQDSLAKSGAREPRAGERAKVEGALAENLAQQSRYRPERGTVARQEAAQRPKTRAQAQREVDRLDVEWDKAVGRVYESTRGEFDKAETARRNKLRAEFDRQQAGVTRTGRASGASGRKVQHRPQTLSQEARDQAERTLLATIEKYPGNSVARRLGQVKQRRDELRAALNASHPVFGEGAPEEFGTVRQKLPGTEGDATLRKLRAHESQLRTRLDQIGQHEKLQQIHQQLVDDGFKAIDNGAFYLPSKDRALTRSRVPATRQPGEHGLGPTGNPPWLAHAFTGALQRSGRARSDATRLASESYKQAQRYATIERGYRQLLAAAHDTPEQAGGAFAIPIRTTVAIPDGLKQLIQKADVGTLTRDDIKSLNQGDVEEFARALFPEKTGDLKNVKWIDSRYLGGLKGTGARLGARDGAGALLDTVNSPFRAALLYTKPSYALNLLQALGTNVIQQGVFTPLNLQRALSLGKQLGAEDQHAIFSLVGAGRSRTYETTGGVAAGTINAAGEFWNAIVDRYPRAASWLHEARREGFNTPDTIHQLIHDERMRDKLVEITRRANKEAIEFGQLSPFEANVLRRFFFFYGWMRGATLYSLRFGKEHPIQAAVLAQLGAQGHERSVNAFGPFVDHGPGTAGLIPVGHGRGMNLSNLNTFSTPVEAAAAAIDPSLIPQQLGPAAGALYTTISGKTPLGVDLPETKNRYAAGAQQLSDLIPLVQALNRAKVRPPSDKVIKQPIFPKGGHAALERYVGGSAFPQPVNKPALNAKGEKNYREKLSGEEKVRYDAGKTLRQAKQDAVALHRAGVLGAPKLPGSVREALDLDKQRRLGYAHAAKQLGVPVGNLSAEDRAGVVARVISDAKTAAPQIIANFERLVAAAPDARAKSKVTAAFWRAYGKGEALSSWRHYVTTNKRQR